MKRIVFLALATVFLTTGCKNLMSSSSGLPQQYEPAFADSEYDAESADQQTFLGSLKSKVTGTADTLKSGVDRVAENVSDTVTDSAESLRETTLSAFGEQYEPSLDDE